MAYVHTERAILRKDCAHPIWFSLKYYLCINKLCRVFKSYKYVLDNFSFFIISIKWIIARSRIPIVYFWTTSIMWLYIHSSTFHPFLTSGYKYPIACQILLRHFWRHNDFRFLGSSCCDVLNNCCDRYNQGTLSQSWNL